MLGVEQAWGLPLAGLCIGVVMGYVARRNHFCTMSALERHWYAGDSTGLRSWVLAAATALFSTQLLIALGMLELSQSFYVAPQLPILGSIVGGLMFGVGMALVGTCGFGAVVRLGGGNLRALVVLTGLGLAAVAAQRGTTAHFRVNFIEPVSIAMPGGQSLGSAFASLTGLRIDFVLALLLTSAAFAWIFSSAAFRRDTGKIVAGVVVGLCITGGWIATSWFAEHLFRPVQIEAGAFVTPVGDLIMQLIVVTGELPDYAVGLVVGVLAGAALAAWRGSDMRWEACDDARELSRHLLGAFLMGTGGVFAVGCTIGQGVSAVSLMAVSTPLTLVSMALGARMGLGYLLEGSPLGFLSGLAGGRRQSAG